MAHSFPGGTLVLMADGTSKPIEQVKPGDTIRATDPQTEQSKDSQVTHSIQTQHDIQYVDLTIRDGKGQEHTVTATENHPFWSVTRHDWVDAGKLQQGELLRTAAGTYVQIGAVKPYRAEQATYDLTVDQLHTYYVGDSAVLVHNCPADLVRAKVDDMYSKMTAAERRKTTYAAAHVTFPDGTTEIWVAAAGKSGYVGPTLRGTALNPRYPITSGPLANLPRINDAEMHLKRAAQALGGKIDAIGATRPACKWCQEKLLPDIPIVTDLL